MNGAMANLDFIQGYGLLLPAATVLLVLAPLILLMCLFFKSRSSDLEKKGNAVYTDTNGSVAVNMSPEPRSSVDLIEPTDSLSECSLPSNHQRPALAPPNGSVGVATEVLPRSMPRSLSYESLHCDDENSYTRVEDPAEDDSELYSHIEADRTSIGAAVPHSADNTSIRSTTELLAEENSTQQSSTQQNSTNRNSVNRSGTLQSTTEVHVYAVVNKNKRSSVTKETAADTTAEYGIDAPLAVPEVVASDSVVVMAADAAVNRDVTGGAEGEAGVVNIGGENGSENGDNTSLHIYSVVNKNRTKPVTNQPAETNAITTSFSEVAALSGDAMASSDDVTAPTNDVANDQTVASAASNSLVKDKLIRNKNFDEDGYESLPEAEDLAADETLKNSKTPPAEATTRQSKNEGALYRLQHGLKNVLPSRQKLGRALSTNRLSEKGSTRSDSKKNNSHCELEKNSEKNKKSRRKSNEQT